MKLEIGRLYILDIAEPNTKSVAFIHDTTRSTSISEGGWRTIDRSQLCGVIVECTHAHMPFEVCVLHLRTYFFPRLKDLYELKQNQ